MKTSRLPETRTSEPTGDSRGADARALLGLRERLDALTSQQSDAAKEMLAVRQADDAALAQEHALAVAIDAEARALELDNHRRAVRLLAMNAAAGIGSFLIASVVCEPPSKRRNDP